MSDNTMPPTDDDLPLDWKSKLRISVPGYQLLSIVGRGGQATVYKAVDLSTGETVAIKILHSGPFADDSDRKHLTLEIISLKALKHPNIVSFIASGQTPLGHDFLIMKYIEGKNLDHFWLDPQSTLETLNNPAAILALFVKICHIVGIAHRSGVTHGDLSPANIRIDTQGEPHLLDFGLACSVFDSFLLPGQAAAVSQEFRGNLAYASPEQFEAKPGAVDIRTDVYALGIILYQILTGGRFPYDVKSNHLDVLNNIVHSQPTPLGALLVSHNLVPDPLRRVGRNHPAAVNPIMEAIVLKALEKDPDRRYRSASEFAQDVESYLAGRPTIAFATAVRSTNARPRRLRLAIVSFLLFAVGAAGALWQENKRPGNQPLPPAITNKATAQSAAAASQGASGSPSQGPRINLLSLLDSKGVDRDHMNWAFRDGQLISHAHGNQLEFPYVPPDEYDYRVVFDAPGVLLGQLMFFAPVHGKRINWIAGDRDNTACGIDKVDSKLAAQNLTTRWGAQWILPGQRNTVVLKIRKSLFEAYLNGALLCHYETDYHEIGFVDWFKARWPNTVGLAFISTGMKIQSAEIVEVTGRGQILPPTSAPSE